jgi:hypothetical protein
MPRTANNVRDREGGVVGKEGEGFAKDLHTLLQAGSMGRLPAGARIAEHGRS